MTTPTKFQTLKPTNMTMLFLVGIETGSYISIDKKKTAMKIYHTFSELNTLFATTRKCIHYQYTFCSIKNR